MAHFTDSGRTWPIGLTDISPGLVDIDAKTKKTISGLVGSAGFTPSTPIIVNGSGFTLQNAVAWDSAKTYSRKVSPFRYTHDFNNGSPNDNWVVVLGPPYSGVQSTHVAQHLRVPFGPELIDGSTINRVQLFFYVDPTRPSQAVSVYPKLWVSRRNEITGVLDLLAFSGSNVFPTPAGGNDAARMASYKNGGAPNTITYTPSNALNTAVIDLSTYTYGVIFDDDTGGTGPFNLVTGLEVRMANVLTLAQP